MADTKITALDALTAADPANDVLPIVDVNDPFMAASGTTKKISINNILGASGTATLASATISGDLTVDTSTLKVDSANNRVGVLNAAPNDTFTIASDNYLSFQTASTGFNSGRAARIGAISAGSGNGYLVFETYQGGSGGAERYRIASDGVATWSNVGGSSGTAMTLNSTGLGVGGAPVNPLTVFAAASAKAPALLLSTAGSPTYGWDFSVDGAVNGNLFIRSLIGGTKTDVLEFDRATGNVGIGVSPGYKLDVNGVARVSSGGDGVFLSSASSPDLYVVGVNYYNNNGTEGVQVSARPSWRIEHKNSSDALAYLDIGFRAASAAASAFTSRFKIDGSGNVISNVTGTAPTLATNSQMVFNLTSNTNLRISVRGSDGVTRTTNLTLA